MRAISIALWGAAIVVAALTFQKVYAAEDYTLIERNKIHNANKKRPAAGCFIPTQHGVFVAINKHHNDIQLPMGKANTGEKPRDAARRETFEEIGIDVMVLQLVHTAIQGRRIYLYLCKPIHRIKFLQRIPTSTKHYFRSTSVGKVIILNPNSMVDQNLEPVETPWRYHTDKALLIELWNDWAKGRQLR
ncbi:hypothetical protein LCGC14_0534270 [marine sediment metagenome]|uniref:Nudix hydrolase domain-containing protein n=1 Tax=marine sediment metagenome TaxID=412755 RepID=A0A0F9V2V3_9ZZZZ